MAQIRETFDDDPVRKPGEHLVMWTIYDHPLDLPEFYVARCYRIVSGEPEPAAGRAVAHKRLLALRFLMQDMGLICIGRNEGDDPVIVETWL